MFYPLHNILRASRAIGFIRAGKLLLTSLLLILCLALPSSAYTIVMRGGHQVLIPDEFEVTPSTITYEAAPGILVTLQMSSIDIAATERANGEPGGGLFRRIGRKFAPQAPAQTPQTQTQTPTVTNPGVPRARKTLTNRDLEPTRLKRLESEAAYERRRQELGLPTREETLRRQRAEAERARELLGRSAAEEADAEGYWRARATYLRNEIHALDAEIGYVRAQLARTPDTLATVSYATIGRSFPFIYTAPVAGAPTYYTRGGSFGQSGAQISGSIGFGGGGPRGGISLNYSNRHGHSRHRGFYNPCLYTPCLPGLITAYPTGYGSFDRAQLLAKLRDLEATRAGLSARWRSLEDEARRAGAQPGWLRP